MGDWWAKPITQAQFHCQVIRNLYTWIRKFSMLKGAIVWVLSLPMQGLSSVNRTCSAALPTSKLCSLLCGLISGYPLLNWGSPESFWEGYNSFYFLKASKRVQNKCIRLYRLMSFAFNYIVLNNVIKKILFFVF